MTYLYESDVVDAVCQYLEGQSFTIQQRLTPKQPGIDVIALRQEPVPIELVVEAKGETSERGGSQRYGNPFDSAQVKIHIAEAFYTAAALTSSPTSHQLRRVAVALPQNALHERYATRIQPAFTALGIGVFWITPDKKVSLVAPWEL